MTTENRNEKKKKKKTEDGSKEKEQKKTTEAENIICTVIHRKRSMNPMIISFLILMDM